MGMKAYPTYKDSGVQWLAEMPSSWNVFPAKQVFADSKERRRTDDTFLTASQKYGVISQQRYMQLIGGRIVQASQDFDKWKHVEPDDFVISLRSFQGGLEMCAERGCVTWHYVVLKPKMEIIPLYFKWLFKSFSYIKSLQSTCNFIRDGQDLRYSNFVQVPIPFPPLTEQKAIASFLDKKCAEIEELISRRQSIIERLRELKQSIIAEAVTKGLNPDVPMKESGIAWMPEVPEHWERYRLPQVLKNVSVTGSDTDELLSVYLDRGVIKHSDSDGSQVHKPSKDMSAYQKVVPGDLVCNNQQAWRGSVGVSSYEGRISPAYIIFKLTPNLYPEYANYLFRSQAWNPAFVYSSKGVGSIQRNLYLPWLRQFTCYLPSISEQKDIVQDLDKKCAEIDELITRHEQTIEKLKELKTSTIANVVTGKVDVRESI